MWGIIPAAGQGSRIQPLAFSKELLPLGAKVERGREGPKTVCEHLIERMAAAGVRKICFVIAPGKTDILRYFGARMGDVEFAYVVQQRPAGLCDALFSASHLIAGTEPVAVGLPDTIWYPNGALAKLPSEALAFLLFHVDKPELFDAVLTGENDRVVSVQVKSPAPGTPWVWGAFRAPGHVYHAMRRLWIARNREDEYFGTLVNAWIAEGGDACGLRLGERYVDVGTLHGYREALALIGEPEFKSAGSCASQSAGGGATPHARI